MKERLARIAADLKDLLAAEAELPSGAHLLTPRAAPRKPPGAASLDRIAAEVRACTLCGLHAGRNHAVPGEGSPRAPLMVIGEAPGHDEDRQGRPFVGQAGRLLTKMLRGIHIEREEVFIGNVLKCRPPDNRDPTEDEAAACRRHLMAQIAAIRPQVILALGGVATKLLLNTTRGILSLRGTPRPFVHPGGTCPLMPTLHPAYLLRNPPAKRDAWNDLKRVHELLREATGNWPPAL